MRVNFQGLLKPLGSDWWDRTMTTMLLQWQKCQNCSRRLSSRSRTPLC